MTLMTGSCLKCGVTYCGWALTNPAFQKCDRCGCELEIFRDGVRVITSNNQVTASEKSITDKKAREEITTSQ